MKLSELTSALNQTTERVKKIGTETQSLLARIEELQAVVANSDNVPQDVQDALASLMAQAGVVDDLVADPVPPEAG